MRGLRERVAPVRTRDGGNSMLWKECPGGILVLTGANNAVGLRSMTARFPFLDEVEAYADDVAASASLLRSPRRGPAFSVGAGWPSW